MKGVQSRWKSRYLCKTSTRNFKRDGQCIRLCQTHSIEIRRRCVPTITRDELILSAFSFQMILYVEREILLDNHCRDVHLCRTDLADEYLLISSSNQCSCSKQSAIFCKCNHDVCSTRSQREKKFFLKQNPTSNKVFINSTPTNLVLFDREEWQENAEMIYLSRGTHVPKPLMEHARNRFQRTDDTVIQPSIKLVRKRFDSQQKLFEDFSL